MSFAPQGLSPFLPGSNYMKVDFGVKKEVDRSLILRKKNNKVNYKRCSDKELLELLEKNEKLLNDKVLLNKLPDKGEKIRLKNKEIKEEISNRNLSIEKEKTNDDNVKDNDKIMTENENKSNDTTTETNNDNDNSHTMEIDSLNEKLQTINISDENDKEDAVPPKIKRGQAKVAEMILKNSTLNNPTFMIPHKPNKSHSKIISIEESLEIQIRQRKIQKEIEINEAKKRLERTIMSTGPVKYHSTDYRNTHNEFDDDDDDEDDDDDDDDSFDNRSYYDSSDAEADEFLFGHK